MIGTPDIQKEEDLGKFATKFLTDFFTGSLPEIFCIAKNEKPFFPILLKTNLTEVSKGTLVAILNTLEIRSLDKEVSKFILKKEHVEEILKNYFHVFTTGIHPNIDLMKELLANFPSHGVVIVFVKKSAIETLIRKAA